MSVIDRLISGLHFNNSSEEEGYEDGDYGGYEEDDPPEEEAPRRRGLFGRRDNSEQDPPEDSDYEEERPAAPRPAMTRQNTMPARQTSMPVPSRRSQNAGSNMQVRIIKPSSFDQSSEITDTLLSHRTVLLNLEGLDVNTAQRIVDFASGSCYALHGNFMKISHFIIVITPEDVDIAGDIDSNGSLMGVLGGAAGGAGSSMAGAQTNAYGNSSYGGASYGNTSYGSSSYGAGAGTSSYSGYGYNGGYSQNTQNSSSAGYQNNYNGAAYSNV